MKPRIVSVPLILLVVLSAAASPASAGWIENGIPVCTELENQMYQRMLSDGSGGTFIVWADYRGGSMVPGIYAQRVDAFGNELWTSGGLPVCTAGHTAIYPTLVTDGSGGIIVAWFDTRNHIVDGYNIYAQRISGDGSIQWTVDGERACNYSGDQGSPYMVSDGQGGAILAWSEDRVNNNDIFAARIDEDGQQAWHEYGVQICVSSSNQYMDDIISDNEGGAVIVWHDYRNGHYDIYAQRVLPNSTIAWTTNGRAICTESGTQNEAKIIRDISGNFILVWKDSRSGTPDIYAQKIDVNGSSRWTTNGIAICAETGYQEYADLVTDGEWGAIIAWEDRRTSPSEIMAQKVTGAGDISWSSGGEPVSGYTGAGKSAPVLVSDGSGGAIVAWKDYRSGTNADVFAERINSSCVAQWNSYGVPVRIEGGTIADNLFAVSDGAGGVTVSWLDLRYADRDLFCQRIERNGKWGYPSPMITDVRDVPGDQGGYINLKWNASRLDPWPLTEISYYTAWRAISESAALSLQKRGVPLLTAGDSPIPGNDGPVVRSTETAAGNYYWELIATIDAFELENYSATLPSLFDSTNVSTEHTYFQVIAHAYTSSIYWISPTDSGYSVDNLAPAAPLALAGEQIYSPEGMLLTWDPNSEIDLAGYNIYRGLGSGFTPGPENFVTSTPDTMTLDDGWSWQPGYWYKVAAVDIHGNESIFAVLGPDMVTGDDPMPLPDATFLAQNFPNPFNPVTTIGFGIKEQGHVSLRIYDAAGRLIATLVNETRPAGSYTTKWNGRSTEGPTVASGVYFYRLITKEFEETKKMILLR